MNRTNEQVEIETRVYNALVSLTHNDVKPWTDLFDEHGVQEIPFAMVYWPKRVEGKSNIAEYLRDFPEKLGAQSIGVPTWHHDGKVAIAEFDVNGTALPTGKNYSQRYISVIEHERGKITRFVDYWNPLVVKEALGDALLRSDTSNP